MVKGYLCTGASSVLPSSQALVSAACLAGAYRNTLLGVVGIRASVAASDGVFALVALFVWLVGDMMELLTCGCVPEPATEELQRPAAAAEGCQVAFQAKASPRVDVGDTPSGRSGVLDVLSGEFGPGTRATIRGENPVIGDPASAFSCSFSW